MGCRRLRSRGSRLSFWGHLGRRASPLIVILFRIHTRYQVLFLAPALICSTARLGRRTGPYTTSRFLFFLVIWGRSMSIFWARWDTFRRAGLELVAVRSVGERNLELVGRFYLVRICFTPAGQLLFLLVTVCYRSCARRSRLPDPGHCALWWGSAFLCFLLG